MPALSLVSECSTVLLNRRDKETQKNPKQTKNPTPTQHHHTEEEHSSTDLQNLSKRFQFHENISSLWILFTYRDKCTTHNLLLSMYAWKKHSVLRLFILVLLTIRLYSLFSSGAFLGCSSIRCRSWKASDAQIYGNIMMKKNPVPRLHPFQVQALRSNYFNRQAYG